MLARRLTLEIMKALIVPLVVALATLAKSSFPHLARLASNTDTNARVEGLYDLVKRPIPQHAGAFRFALAPGNPTAIDTFTLRDATLQDDNCSAQIDIECNSISACARGLYTCISLYNVLSGSPDLGGVGMSLSLEEWTSGGPVPDLTRSQAPYHRSGRQSRAALSFVTAISSIR